MLDLLVIPDMKLQSSNNFAATFIEFSFKM